MTNAPKYMTRLIDGQVRIFRSDGQTMSEDDAKWVRKVLTAQVRAEALAISAGKRIDAALDEPDVDEGLSSRTGSRIIVHPLIHKMKQIIKANGWPLAVVSRLLGKSDAAVSTWLRGQATPSMTDLFALYGLAGYKLIPVPLAAVQEAQALVLKCETEQAQVDQADSVGEAPAED